MPTNETPKYHLNQWVRSDRILMEDFNADNAKIDAALADQAGTLAAHAAALAALAESKADKTALNQKGNCKIVYQVYTGDGTYGPNHPKVFAFPSRPLAVIFGFGRAVAVTFYGSTGFTTVNGSSTWTYSITWGENSFSLMNANQADYQLNQLNTKYTMIALLAADG